MDDIEKLLAEVSNPSPQPAPPPARTKRGGRLAFAGVAAVVLGVTGWVAGLLLPFVGGPTLGSGAALGAFVTAVIAGPPRWFSS